MKKYQHQTSKVTTQGLAANAPNDSGESTTHPQMCHALRVLFPKCFLPQKSCISWNFPVQSIHILMPHCTLCTLFNTMPLYLLWPCIRYNKKKGWIQARAVESESLKVGKSLKIGKNRIKSEKLYLISYPTFWQKCQNAINCHKMPKCLHFGSGSCIRIS